MDYKQKLKLWNCTDKYKSELSFLYSLLNPQRGQKILDYGCGTGFAMQYIHARSQCSVFGFDITEKYYEWEDFYFRNSIYFNVDCIYFMHSLAHIVEPERIIKKCKEQFLNYDGKIVVITPNYDWLNLKNEGKKIITDETVIRHFTSETIEQLFSDFTILNSGQFGERINNQHERLFFVAK